MDIAEAVKQRRSIRQYAQEVPPDEDIRKILEAATWAPSGLNNHNSLGLEAHP